MLALHVAHDHHESAMTDGIQIAGALLMLVAALTNPTQGGAADLASLETPRSNG
jgi:hypothetical protein